MEVAGAYLIDSTNNQMIILGGAMQPEHLNPLQEPFL
jgi:hypothetical protein